METLKYLLIFIVGMLFQYVFNLLDLFMQDLQNKQTLKATKIQVEINQLSEATQELEPVIGFQIPNQTEEFYEE